MRTRILPVAIIVLAACSGPTQPPQPSAPSPSAGVSGEPDEETRANWPQVRLNTPFGPQTFYYQERDGLAFAEGDILLGPVQIMEALAAGNTGSGSPAFALANTAPDSLWPDARVPFVFAPDANHIPDINAMIAEYEARTPLRFVNRTNEYHHVEFTSSPINNYGQIGRQWWGATKVGISPTMAAGPTAQTVIVHEIGHSVGLFHEHTRKDRNSFVTINWPCVNPLGYGNFFQRTDPASVDLEIYDTASVMHYFPTAFSIDGTCTTITVQDGVPPISRTNRLSVSDVNALWKLYGDFGSSNAQGDMFGQAMVAADFDADGHTDLAVGAPQKTIDGMQRRGAVYMFKGTDTVLAPWGRLDFSSRAVPAAGDRFGRALAVGDFNDDGVPDLAVGLPGRDDGQGAVAVFRGQRGRPLRAFSFHTAQTQGLGSYGAGNWGASLSAGDVDGDGFAEIAAGAPSGLRPDRQAASGYVYVMRGSELGHVQGLVLWERSSTTNFGAGAQSEAGDRFGAAVLLADWSGDGRADLAVGAPRDRSNGVSAGSVFLFTGDAAGPQVDRRLQAPLADRTGLSSFGASLAAGDWNDDGQLELAVGAPGANAETFVQAGKVYFANPRLVDMLYAALDQTGLEQNAAGDGFGASIHSADLDGDGDADLIIGANANLSSAPGGPRPGMAMGLRNDLGTLVPWFRLFAESVETDHNFGITLASGDFDNNDQVDIWVGASQSRLEEVTAPQSGVVHMFRNFRITGGNLNPISALHQRYRWRGLIHEAAVNP